jgi:hypothetical protein
MIYFPETINTISTTNTIPPTRSLVFPWLCTLLTLCMLASWSHEGAVFLDLLSSSHSVTSSLFPYLGSTDAPCSRLGDPVPPSPKWRHHSQGPRTLPSRDPEQAGLCLQALCAHLPTLSLVNIRNMVRCLVAILLPCKSWQESVECPTPSIRRCWGKCNLCWPSIMDTVTPDIKH